MYLYRIVLDGFTYESKITINNKSSKRVDNFYFTFLCKSLKNIACLFYSTQISVYIHIRIHNNFGNSGGFEIFIGRKARIEITGEVEKSAKMRPVSVLNIHELGLRVANQ